MSKNAELLARWYRDVWERNDLDAIARYFHPEAEADGIVPELSFDAAEFRELVGVMLTMIKDVRFEFLQVVEQDEWLCALVRFSCESRETGERMSFNTQTMVRILDDRFLEAHNAFDFLTFFEELGQLPPNSVGLLLSGTRMS